MPSFGTTMLWNASISPHGRTEIEACRRPFKRGKHTPDRTVGGDTFLAHNRREAEDTRENNKKEASSLWSIGDRERERKRAAFYSNVLAFKVCFGCIGIIWTECSSLDGLARCINSGEKKGKSHLSLFSQRTKDFSIVSISIHRQGRANNRVRRGFYLPVFIYPKAFFTIMILTVAFSHISEP